LARNLLRPGFVTRRRRRGTSSLQEGLCLALFFALSCASPVDYTGKVRSGARSSVALERAGHTFALGAQASERLIEQAAPANGRSSLERMLGVETALTGRPLVASNSVHLLVDGPAAYKALFAAIAHARNHVHLETYILADDEIGRRLGDLLVARRKHGVSVRILYDGIGSAGTSAAFLDHLRSAGIEIQAFHPLDPLQDPKIWELDNRDHRKLAIVDGRVGFTGGMNISDVYARSSLSAPRGVPDLHSRWRDTQIRIEGPAVAELQKLFLAHWREAAPGRASPRPRASYFPTLEPRGNDLVRIVASAGGGDRYEIYNAYLAAVEHARERIWVTQAYFIPGERFVGALQTAARRGVDVRLLVPGLSDHATTLAASRSYYSELLEAGARVFERSDAMVHAKTAVIDGVWSTVGSSNLDDRSFLHNDEANAVVIGRSFGAQMERLFAADLGRAHEVDGEAWARRSIGERMHEELSRLFAYWI
jgi:cardiolipin synthase